jgi:hypothetical protein
MRRGLAPFVKLAGLYLDPRKSNHEALPFCGTVKPAINGKVAADNLGSTILPI